MRPQIIPGDCFPVPALNGVVAAALEEIADGSARVNYTNGICSALSGILEKEVPHPGPWVNGYEFVSSVSDAYEEFEENLHFGCRWCGHDGDFRRNWCREVAAALRAGEIFAFAAAQ